MRGVVSRFSRPARTLAALGFLTSGVLMLLAPAGAQTDESSGSYAKLSMDGWWERKPNFPNVPANALPVAAERGEPSRVSAIGLDMFVADTEEFIGLTLTLKESSQPGSSFPPITEQGQAQPQTRITVVACPITSIWTPADGGDLAARPTADCDMARGDGVRGANGIWTFDLSSLAELWMADTIQQNGILLIERSVPPVSFQVSYDDLSTGTPTLTLETAPIEDEAEEDEDLQEDFEDFVETGGGETDEDENFFDAIADDVTGTTDTPFGITDTPPTTAPPPPAAERVSEPVVNRRPTKGSLPLGTLALVPIALGLALLFGVVLGPAGDPATARRREGGLSRALAHRATTAQQS